MLFRAARYYLRMEWLKLTAAVFIFVLYAVLAVNNMSAQPMTYETFVTQYAHSSYSDEYIVEKLAKWENIPREQLGDSLEEAYPLVNERHFVRFLESARDFVCSLCAILAGGLASLLLCTVFRKRRLGPLLASGCPRGAVYLFLAVLYFAFFLLIWIIIVPLCFSRYRIIPLTAEQQACLRLLKPSLLIALLFEAAVSFFAAFLIRRPVPVFLISAVLLFLLWQVSGLVPGPSAFLTSLIAWEAGTETGPLIAQGCITAAAAVAAVVGGWFCFRRLEQA